MPQPIMKKYKHGEMGDTYGMPTKEKPQANMMKKYKHGEFSDAGGKAPKAKLDGTAFWGASIVKYNRNTESREDIGKSIAQKKNATIIPPFDDIGVINGQGTAGFECIAQ